MKKSFPKILMCFLLVILTVSNIYFISKYMEPSIYVQVGLPIFNEESGVSATIMSPFVGSKKDSNTILLAFMMAHPMEEEWIPAELSHAYLIIHYDGYSYPHRMWLTEDSVIFEASTEDVISFREFHNDGYNVVPLLKNLVESLKNNKFS